MEFPASRLGLKRLHGSSVQVDMFALSQDREKTLNHLIYNEIIRHFHAGTLHNSPLPAGLLFRHLFVLSYSSAIRANCSIKREGCIQFGLQT
jgi:hypothetical protein